MNDVEAAVQAAPLVARLVERFGARWVDDGNVEAFVAEPGDHVLFFSGDPVRFPVGSPGTELEFAL